MGTGLVAKVFSRSQPVPKAGTWGDIDVRIERNTARAWLRSGIVAPIGEQCRMAHNTDALTVSMTGHPLLGVRPPFRVALENAARCKLSGDASGIATNHQPLPAFAR